MSSVQYLTNFVNERLTAAVEEILGVFKKCVVEYEEEIDRQRRLLDVVWKPEIGLKLHRIELPLETNPSVDQEDPDPPQNKEDREGEQLVLKQEAGSFMLTPTCGKSDISEDQTLLLSPDETLSATEKEPVVIISVQSSVVSEPNKDDQLLSHTSHAAESQDHTTDNHGNSESTREAEPKPNKRQKSNSHSNDLCNSAMLEVHLNTHTGKKLFKCDTCGRAFEQKSNLNRHLRIHTGEKPYICKMCGRALRTSTNLKVHMLTHTGEKPYSCDTCGKRFSLKSGLTRHTRTHAGEKPYFCKICGRAYSNLTLHMRTHTGEKLCICSTCGKRFCQTSDLKRHIRTHTGEKPYACKTCGEHFKLNSHLTEHMRTHTG